MEQGVSDEAARQQSLIDLEQLYEWLQQFEDPTIATTFTIPTKSFSSNRKYLCLLFIQTAEEHQGGSNRQFVSGFGLLPPDREDLPLSGILSRNGLQVVADGPSEPSLGGRFEVVGTGLCVGPRNGVTVHCNISDLDLVTWFFGGASSVQIVPELGFDFCYLKSTLSEHDLKHILVAGTKLTVRHQRGGTLLHYAAEKGYVSLCEALLKSGASTSDRNNYDATPLHVAITSNHRSYKIMKLLLEHGASVDATTNGGSTPLHLATMCNYTEMVQVLIKKGAHINAKTKAGSTPMHLAAQLLRQDFRSQSKRFPRTAQSEVIQVLAENGGSVDVETNDGRTVLFEAVTAVQFGGRQDLCDYVLSLGPDVNVAGNKKAFHFALRDEGKVYERLVDKMFKYGFRVDAGFANDAKVLPGAIRKQQSAIVGDLLRLGAEPNQYVIFNDRPSTPLHVALRLNQKDSLRLLLDHGANASFEDDSLHIPAPLTYAVQKADLEVVKLLLAAVGQDQRNPALLRLLIEAPGQLDRLDILEHLLEEGFDPNVTLNKNSATSDDFALTPVFLAARKSFVLGNFDLIEVLLKFGARFSLDGFPVDGRADPWFFRAVEFYLSHCFKVTDRTSKTRLIRLLSLITPTESEMRAKMLIVRHSVRIEAVYECVDTKSHIPVGSYEHHGLEDFKEECKKELEAMKLARVSDSSITFYHVLVGNVEQISSYALNRSISQVFETDVVETKFPIYGLILSCKFREGRVRKSLVEKGTKALCFLFKKLPDLPDVAVASIVAFLSNKDLAMLGKCLPVE